MEVEQLLRRELRAKLPLAQQVLLYLDPFAFFKDASRGTAMVRERNLSYNRGMRWVLVPYLRRWLLIATSFGKFRPGTFSFSVRDIYGFGIIPKHLPPWFNDLDKSE